MAPSGRQEAEAMSSDDAATEKVKERVLARVDALAGDLCDLSRDLHAHPETAFEERRSAASICSVASVHPIS